MNISWLLSAEFWEIASYVVTVVALPFAVIVFYLEQRKERQNEEEEIYQQLTDEYADFSKILLDHADLALMSNPVADEKLSTEQKERKQIIYDLLVSLFERAYILVYEEDMNKQNQRLWATWDDYIKFWCKRKDFRVVLPELLQGEDPDFIAYINKIVKHEEQRS
jgi:hypothetical protein